MIDQTKKRGESSQFDCIVGWSGGRDSTSLLYELVKKHKLRCIAVFIRTPFTPAEIIENVYSISKKLGVRLIEKNTPDNHLEIASYCIKEYTKTKIPILINLACASCKYVNQELFKQAHLLGVKTVIYGGNRYEYIPFGAASIEIKTKDRFSFNATLRDNAIRILKGFQILATSPRLFKYFFTLFQASILYVNPYTTYLRLRYPKISRFDYFFYSEWDETKIHMILNELEWKLPSGCNSTWKADCLFEAIKNASYKQRMGFTYSHSMYSNLIRAGKMTRLEALSRLEKEGISEQRLNEALDLCGLSKDTFS